MYALFWRPDPDPVAVRLDARNAVDVAGPAITGALDTDGYAFVESLIDPETAAAFHQRLADLQGDDDDIALANQRVWDLPGNDPTFDALLVHPVLVAAARHLLDDDVHLVEACGQIVNPGREKQYLHADQNPAPAPWPEAAVLTAVWMILPFSVANGALEVVPGSHREGGPPPYRGELPPSRPMEGPAGSVVLMDGRTWHQAGANATDGCRCAVIVTFGRRHVGRSGTLRSLGDPAIAARYS